MAETPASEADLALMKRLTDSVTEWAAYMGITPQWSIKVGLSDFDKDATGCATSAWPCLYKKATITFDRKQMQTISEYEFKMTVLHELLHLVIAPLDDMVQEECGRRSYVYFRYNDLREGVTDAMTNILMKALSGEQTILSEIA